MYAAWVIAQLDYVLQYENSEVPMHLGSRINIAIVINRYRKSISDKGALLLILVTANQVKVDKYNQTAKTWIQSAMLRSCVR